MPIAWSSTTFARWYVGMPSLLTSTWSSTSDVWKLTSPRTASWKVTVSSSGTSRRTVCGSPASRRRWTSSASRVRLFAISARIEP